MLSEIENIATQTLDKIMNMVYGNFIRTLGYDISYKQNWVGLLTSRSLIFITPSFKLSDVMTIRCGTP